MPKSDYTHKLSPVRTGDKNLDRIQDNLSSVINPVLSNPVLNMRDWRFIETTIDDGSKRQLLMQYRTAPSGAWITVNTYSAP